MKKNIKKNKINNNILFIGIILVVVGVILTIMFTQLDITGDAQKIVRSQTKKQITPTESPQYTPDIENVERIKPSTDVNLPIEPEPKKPTLTKEEIDKKIQEALTFREEFEETSYDVIEITYNFSRPTITKVSYGSDEYDYLTIPGLPNLGKVGDPDVPIQSVEILLPYGAEVDKSEIIPENKIELSGTYTLAPVQQPIPILPLDELKEMGYSLEPTKPNPSTYSSRSIFPSKINTDVVEQVNNGYKFAVFNLYPIEYIPQQGKISYYETITIKLTLKPGAIPKTFRSSLNDLQQIKSLMDVPPEGEIKDNAQIKNLDTLNSYEQKIQKINAKNIQTRGDTKQLQTPPLHTTEQHPPCEYVIITKQEFVSAFQPLKNWKETRPNDPMTACIFTTEEIMNGTEYSCYGPYNWGDGCGSQNQFNDGPAHIRNFIRYAYTELGTEYVLLGGDADKAVVGEETEEPIVPVRYFGINEWLSEDHPIPSDVYYSNLDGSWNPNDDGCFCETEEAASSLDWYSEVAVGRAPVDSIEEITNFVNKTIYYETHPVSFIPKESTLEKKGSNIQSVYFQDIISSQTGLQRHILSPLMVGEKLGFGGVSEYATSSMEEIRLGSANHGYDSLGFVPLFEKNQVKTLYDSESCSWSPTDELIPLINSNTLHLINHLGHGSLDYIMKFHNSDIDYLNNTKPIFIYSQGCYAGSFDNMRYNQEDPLLEDSIAEQLVTKQYGAFAVIMNSRYGWGAICSTNSDSQQFARTFWDGAFLPNVQNNLGNLNIYSHERNNWRISTPRQAQYVYYETNLLGDPELKLKLPKYQRNLRIELVNAPNVVYYKDLTGIPIKIKVTNNGIQQESNINVKIVFNNQEIHSENIQTLNPEESTIINYDIPSSLYLNFIGYIELKVNVSEIPNEPAIDNTVVKKIWFYNFNEGFNIFDNDTIFDCATSQNPTGQPIPVIAGPLDYTGIYIGDSNNVTIKNCVFKGWSGGIEIYDVNNSVFENNIFMNNGGGIWIVSSNHCQIENNIFMNNEVGINIFTFNYNSNGNQIFNNIACNNSVDISNTKLGDPSTSTNISGSNNRFNTIDPSIDADPNWPIYGVHYCYCNEIWDESAKESANACVPFGDQSYTTVSSVSRVR